MDRSTRVQLILWFPLVMVLGGYSAKAALEYAFDLQALYRHPKATKLHREAAWSNLRNEVGRLLIAQLFLMLGINGVKKLPAWLMFIEFFGIANYKLFCSVQDRRLRLMLLDHDKEMVPRKAVDRSEPGE